MGRTRKLAGPVLAGAGLVATGVAASMGIRAARERMRRNSETLNDTLPVHSAWWRERAKHTGELLYVAIGDSAAQGIGASAPEHSYVGVIADRVRELTGRTLRVVNLSVSGATVALAVADQLPRFRSLTPDLVTVAIGANDIVAFDPDAFETGIRTVFSALPAHAIVADLPCFYLPWNEKKVVIANQIVRSVAAECGLVVVPLHQATQRGVRGILTEFAADLFHPNNLGYRTWASAFLPAVSASIAARALDRRPA